MRTTIEFNALDGNILRGWLFRPEASSQMASKGLAAIVMTNGFSGVKETIDHYAEAFCAAGFVVLLYDSRGFGASDGPRQHVEPTRQISDFRDAISFLQALEGVDPERIGVWGTSLSGGHAI